MTNFDWQKSQLNEHAQCCVVKHDKKRYTLVASETLRKGEFQAMCNAVRVTKEFFGSALEAKAECERWFLEEVIKDGA